MDITILKEKSGLLFGISIRCLKYILRRFCLQLPGYLIPLLVLHTSYQSSLHMSSAPTLLFSFKYRLLLFQSHTFTNLRLINISSFLLFLFMTYAKPLIPFADQLFKSRALVFFGETHHQLWLPQG